MSALMEKKILVEVKSGDCVDENRKSGRSNTGTYFISSNKTFDEFSVYFKESNKYFLDLVKVEIYKIEFKHFFGKCKNQFVGKMENFDSCCEKLLNFKINQEVKIALRINDSRIFMRFENNSNEVVSLLRKILYEDISQIAIEKHDDHFLVYPIINKKMIELHNDIETGFVFDED